MNKYKNYVLFVAILSAQLFPKFIFSQNTKITFGIASVLDSSSGLSRSFALLEILDKSNFQKDKKSIVAELVDYPYRSNYAVSGTFYKSIAKFKIYKNGALSTEFTCAGNWKNIIEHISDFMKQENYIAKKRFSDIDEGKMYKFKKHEIENAFPGAISTEIPASKLVDTFRHVANVIEYKDKDPATMAKYVFGLYANFNENELFFFRNNDIPYNLKLSVKPLVFPTNKWLAPSLTYLSCGSLFRAKGDFNAALNAYLSALNASNSLIVSPYERAMVKYVTFNEMYNLYAKEFPDRQYLAKLLKLGADLNSSFLNSYQANTQRSAYYSGVQQIERICGQAETQAREIRSTKRTGFFIAALNTAAAFATVSPTDNTASNAFMDQAKVAVDQTTTQAGSASTSLRDAFDNIEQKINASSFVLSDETQSDPTRSYLAEELLYFLLYEPETTRDVLICYASDKSVLSHLVSNYYNTSENSAERSSSLLNLIRHIAEMEAMIVASEGRDIRLTQKSIAKF